MIENNRYCWSHLKTKTVTVSLKPKQNQQGVIFRVSNMIDIGCGRQTVMLEHVGLRQPVRKNGRDAGFIVPFSMGSLNFIYTSRTQPVIQNVHSLITSLYNDSKVEKIVPEVLSPGDLLIFGHHAKKMDCRNAEADDFRVKMLDALRPVKIKKYA